MYHLCLHLFANDCSKTRTSIDEIVSGRNLIPRHRLTFVAELVYDAIEAGAYPKWKFGVQIVEDEKEHDFDFGKSFAPVTNSLTDRAPQISWTARRSSPRTLFRSSTSVLWN
jgi:hypothetical protein